MAAPLGPVPSHVPAPDRPPSGELVLAPTAQAAIEQLLHRWAALPYGHSHPLGGARLEPKAAVLIGRTGEPGSDVVLSRADHPPWFAIRTPNDWPAEAVVALRGELGRTFASDPWTVAARDPGPQEALRAAQLQSDRSALLRQALPGPPSHIPMVPKAYAITTAAVLVGAAVLLTLYLLRRHLLRRRR